MNSDLKELNDILFRFALTDNGEAFNKFLDNYMVSVIEKLNHESDQAIKKKVLEVLSNINKRTMFSPPGLEYPIDSLIKLYHSPTSAPTTKNFAIIYIEKAFNSLASDKRQAYLTPIVTDLYKLPSQHQDIFCHIILNIIMSMNLSSPQTISLKNDVEKDKLYPWRQSERDVKIVLSFMLDLLMVPTNVPLKNEEGVIMVPPGHSLATLQRVMGKGCDKYDAKSMNERKIAVLQLCGSGLFADTDVVVPVIVSSCDVYQEVSKRADDQLKRLPKINWESEALISHLFSLFQGEQPNGRQPASNLLREKILHNFCRSILAANRFPSTLQVIFEGVYGTNSTMKVKHAAMSFVQWVFRHAQSQYIESMGPIILSGLMKLLDSMDGELSKEENELKAFTYSSLGHLCKRNKKLFNTDLNLVMKLMTKITKEEPIVASAIQDCLLMLREAFVDLTDENLSNNLLRVLLTFIYNGEYLIRLIVLQWAQQCFKFNNVASRYFSLVMVGDIRPDIREEARRGLEPYTHNGNMLVPAEQNEPYPDFKLLLEYVVKMRKEILENKSSVGKLQGIVQMLGYSSVSYENILIMLRKCLAKTAIANGQSEQDYFSKEIDMDLGKEYLEMIECAILAKADEDLYLVGCISLLHLINIKEQDQLFAKNLSSKVTQMNQWIKQGKYQTKELVAKMIAEMSIHLDQSTLESMMLQYIDKITSTKDVVELYGPLTALCHVWAKLNQTAHPIPQSLKDRIAQDIIPKVEELIQHNNISIKVLAVGSCGLLGLYSPLPTKTKEDEQRLIKSLMTLVEGSSTERSVQESALVALGWIVMGDRKNMSSTKKTEIIDCLFKQINNKNEELQFSIGETLSLIMGGHLLSPIPIYPFSPFTIEEIKQQMLKQGEEKKNLVVEDKEACDEMTKLFKRILVSYFSDRQSPITRCSAGIWMLCLLKSFGKLEFVQDLLAEIQNGFCSLLSDNNELTQDIASRGITLVYDSSNDPKFREFLVSNLGKTLAGKPTQKAPGSSELLPEGSVTKSGQVSTYKELSSLSNDLGKPDMIYKFMNLSQHHQIWNSRKGASFAIVSLAGKAREEMAPLIPHLVPKIYRYLYDPSPKIAASMQSIMSAIIDQKDIFPKYFAPIMKELLAGMGTSAWRVREASCAAIPDTITNASIEDIEPFIEELYYMNFRTLDDIKESVRKAAESSIRSLGSVTSRFVDPGSTVSRARANHILGVVIPLLLTKGITNDSAEVRQFTLQILLKISNSAKEQIAPFVPEMVHVLLESLSSLEPAMLNYAMMHAESLNVKQEDLENLRVDMSKKSVVNDVLETCLKYINQDNINQVMSNLIQMVQFSVGMVTRVGVAKFIANIFQSRVVQIEIGETYIQKLINNIFPSIMDKSAATRRQFIQTLCICIKKSNIKIIKQSIQYVMDLINKDNGSEENTVLEVVGLFFRELYRIASSEIQSFNKDLIPFLYFQRSHPKKEVADLYKTIWEDNSIGSIKLYTDEIIKLVSTNLLGTSWSAKQQAALCLSNLTEDIRNMIDGHLPIILQLLMQGLKGKTYPGKDSLLASMSTITTICHDRIKNSLMTDDNSGDNSNNNIPSGKDMLLAMLQECKKIDLEYKRKALINLTSMIRSFGDIDLYNPIKELVYPLVFIEKKEKDSSNNNDQMAVDDDPKQKPLQLMVRTAVYGLIGEAYAASSLETKRENVEIGDKLLNNLVYSIWNEQVAILSSLKLFIKSIYDNQQQLGSLLTDSWIDSLLSKSFECLSTSKYGVVKKGTLELLEQLIESGQQIPSISKHFTNMKLEMEQAAKKDSTLGVQVDKIIKRFEK